MLRGSEDRNSYELEADETTKMEWKYSD